MWKELTKAIEGRREIGQRLMTAKDREALEEENRKKVVEKNNEENKLKKRVARGAWNIEKEKATLHLSQERIQSYEEAFAKIQAATGETDIDRLVDNFIAAEDKNFSLFNHVNELSTETEQLDLQIANVKREIEKYKGQGASSDNQRKKILRDLETRLEKTTAKVAECDAVHQVHTDLLLLVRISLLIPLLYH